MVRHILKMLILLTIIVSFLVQISQGRCPAP